MTLTPFHPYPPNPHEPEYPMTLLTDAVPTASYDTYSAIPYLPRSTPAWSNAETSLFRSAAMLLNWNPDPRYHTWNRAANSIRRFREARSALDRSVLDYQHQLWLKTCKVDEPFDFQVDGAEHFTSIPGKMTYWPDRLGCLYIIQGAIILYYYPWQAQATTALVPISPYRVSHNPSEGELLHEHSPSCEHNSLATSAVQHYASAAQRLAYLAEQFYITPRS